MANYAPKCPVCHKRFDLKTDGSERGRTICPNNKCQVPLRWFMTPGDVIEVRFGG